MKLIWDRIHAWLVDNAPEVLASLQPGATDEQIRAAEKELGVSFPADVKAAYRTHNGQAEGPRGYPPAFLYGWEWLSLERILDEWGVWKGLVEAGDFDDCESEPDDGVRSDWFNLAWVPLTYSGSGDHHCLDLDPAEGGQAGQIIQMWHDATERPLVAPTFLAWLSEFADDLEADVYNVTEYGLEES